MIQQKCIESYARLKNLKLVGEEVGIRWQSVYVHLKKAGVKVTGDIDTPDDAPPLRIDPGSRVAQALIIPAERVTFTFSDELSETERGAGGFGSTGK